MAKRISISVFALLLSALPAAYAASVAQCLGSTGFAVEGFSSSGVYVGGISPPNGGLPLFNGGVSAPTLIFCAPATDVKGATSAGGAAVVEYAAGTGIQVSTSTLANPDGPKTVGAKFSARITSRFSVAVNNPSVLSFPATLHTLLEVGDVIAEVTSTGSATNYANLLLRLDPVGGFAPSYAFLLIDGTPVAFSSNELDTSVELHAGREYDLSLQFLVESTARSTLGTQGIPPGSGRAGQSLTATLELEIPSEGTVTFAYEDALGLPPPGLGVIAPSFVPVPPALYGLASGSLVLLSLARKKNRHVVTLTTV